MSPISSISRSVALVATLIGLVGCDSSPTAATGIPANPDFALVTNESQLPFAFSVPACDEVVNVAGVYHIVLTSTISPNGETTDRFHINAKGTGTGQTSGATYQWNDAINQTVHDAPTPSVVSATQTTTLVGQGGAPNLRARFRFHLTVNANGEMTVLIDEFEEICK
jgi:hypothetical protein